MDPSNHQTCKSPAEETVNVKKFVFVGLSRTADDVALVLPGRFDGLVKVELQLELRVTVVVAQFAMQKTGLDVGAVMIFIIVTRLKLSGELVV